MDMKEQSQKFIDLLEQKKSVVEEDALVLADIIQSLQSIFERYYDSNKVFVKKLQLLDGYSHNLIHTKRDSLPMIDRCSTKCIAEDLQSVLDSAIEEVRVIGLPTTNSVVSRDININNTLNQTQNQRQEINRAVDILLEALKDDLTGKQRKELIALAKEAATPEEARKGIIEKLKSFGEGVTTSIVANILTNPQVWDYLGMMI